MWREARHVPIRKYVSEDVPRYPSISTLLSCSITYILEDCLKPDPAQRPTAGRVSDALDGIIMGFNSMQLEIER